MNVNYLFRLVLCFVCVSISDIALGQKDDLDTLFVSNAKTKARTIYTEEIAGEAHLFNGVQYQEPNLHNYDKGHPYYLSDDWVDGSIFYDGQWYENISILYNINYDKVIIDHPYSHFSIELIKEKLKAFSILNHKFVRLESDSVRNSPIRTGIYDALYDGNVKVYAKRRKETREVIEARNVSIVFSENDQFFIYKNGFFFPVKSKSSVLKVFSDRKSALRKFIKKNQLKFNADRELALTESARFYDESEKQL